MSIVQLSTKYLHSIFLLKDGTVKGCGSNAYGQLGLPKNTVKQFGLITIPDVKDVVQVSAGGYHSLFLLKDGTVMSCGNDGNGQLGTSMVITNGHLPTLIPDVKDVVQVSAGGYHSLFLLKDGTVKVCGSNGNGQLGLTSEVKQVYNIRNIPDLIDVISVAAGVLHSLFLLRDGTVKVCGSNGQKRIWVHNNVSSQFIPTLIPDLVDVIAIEAGGYNSSYLLKDGIIKSYGGLTNTSIIPDVKDVVQVSAGEYHYLFLLKDGTVKVHGSNAYGQLGLPSNRPTVLIPTVI